MKSRWRFPRGFRGGICANSVLLLLLAAPAAAMTPEDCQRAQEVLSISVPAVREIRISPTVTSDLWCRVVEGPIGGGWEWRSTQEQGKFKFEFRQERFSTDNLGPFEVSGQVRSLGEGDVRVGPITLKQSDTDAIVMTTHVGTGANGTDGRNGPPILLSSTIVFDSGSGIIDEVLSWAFRQDLEAARSSFISARDQRKLMIDWLETTAEPITDQASITALAQIFESYPRTRGEAVLSAGADGPVQIGALLAAVFKGTSFSRSEAGTLIEDSGLRLTWRPD